MQRYKHISRVFKNLNADADARVTVIALHILRIIELKMRQTFSQHAEFGWKQYIFAIYNRKKIAKNYSACKELYLNQSTLRLESPSRAAWSACFSAASCFCLFLLRASGSFTPRPSSSLFLLSAASACCRRRVSWNKFKSFNTTDLLH